MLLYSFRRCPYAIRARLMLSLSKLECEIIEVSLKNKPEKMLSYSPKGTVPVLILDDGTVIDESFDIVVWALKQSKPKGWQVLKSKEIKSGDDLLHMLHHILIPALNRYKYASRYDDVDLNIEEGKIKQYLDTLNQLCMTSVSLFESCSVYDVLIFPLIRQVNIANPNWLPQYDKLNQWFTNWLTNPDFVKVMEKK